MISQSSSKFGCGRAQTIEGRSALLFGVDAMAALGMKDLIPGMQHELFHRYHCQFFEYVMAMYVSEQLNPSAIELDLGLVPQGMAQQVDERRAQVAADFLRKFESTSEKDAALYINSPDRTDAVVPPRAGYRLGMLVVREQASSTRPLILTHLAHRVAGTRQRQLSSCAGHCNHLPVAAWIRR